MKVLIVCITLAATFCITPQLWAKTFYLKNGDQIEYQRYWKKDGRIHVLLNRDTEVEFSPKEVDLKNTKKAAKLEKKIRHKKPVKRTPRRAAIKPVSAEKSAPVAKGVPAAKSASATKLALSAKPVSAGVKPATTP